VITEANELEEIFKSEDDQKVYIPNLNTVVFDMLPSLRCAQGNQFQTVKNRFVKNCQKLNLTSASTTNTFTDNYELVNTTTYTSKRYIQYFSLILQICDFCITIM
jgi:hypothetical protein